MNQNKGLTLKENIKANRIHIVPFKHINAITDIGTGDIFLSAPAMMTGDTTGILCDESVHISSKNPDHDEKWEKTCMENYGFIPAHNGEFDKLRRRLGIPNNIAANIGNITGIQNILTDYHLLQAYRKFSQRILATEGHWEWLGDKKIRLYPTPKGAMPVVVEYIPPMTDFRSPISRQICMDMFLAQAMIMLGNTRGKFSGIPSPDGGSMTLNGSDLASKGQELYKEIIEKAIALGEPLGFFTM